MSVGSSHRFSRPGWSVITASVIVSGVLLVGSWYAGRQSGKLEAQPLSAQLDQLTNRLASTELELKQERAKMQLLQPRVRVSGQEASFDNSAKLRQKLAAAQAEADQYKAILDREEQLNLENARLVKALSSPGTRILAMKGSEGGGSSAYVFVVEKSGLLFIGSGLPPLSEARQFQLWVVKRQASKPISAGVFSADESNSAFLEFPEPDCASDVAHVELTDEPVGGSSEPTGTKLFESASQL